MKRAKSGSYVIVHTLAEISLIMGAVLFGISLERFLNINVGGSSVSNISYILALIVLGLGFVIISIFFRIAIENNPKMYTVEYK